MKIVSDSVQLKTVAFCKTFLILIIYQWTLHESAVQWSFFCLPFSSCHHLNHKEVYPVCEKRGP